MLASEVAVLKSCDGISVKCSQYRDTRPTNPGKAIKVKILDFFLKGRFLFIKYLYFLINIHELSAVHTEVRIFDL